jgi:hypothetical protein
MYILGEIREMVMFRKKLLFICAFLVSFAGNIAAEEHTPEMAYSGRKSIEYIMLNNDTGMGMTKHINPNPAESVNLLNDLSHEKLIKALPCKLLVGPIFIEEKIKSPYRSTDKKSVLRKQHFVRTLVENSALKNRVDELLTQAQECEQDVAILFSDDFKNERCSELAQLELLKKEESFQYPLKKYFSVNAMGRTLWVPIAVFMALTNAKGARWSIDNTVTNLHGAVVGPDIISKFNSSWNASIQAGLGLVGGFSAFFGFYGLYRDYTNAVEKRSKMRALNKLIQITRELESLCKEYGIETEFSVNDIQDKKGIDLLKDLEHERYKDGDDSAFFNISLVHTAAYALYKNDKQLAPIFASLAEMDAYNAFATKIVESHDKKNKFCLVEIIEADRPRIDARGFWSLLVKNPVVNDLCEDRHVLLTGPNAGGKSTSIRSTLQNILLGQCFGVAAAESFRFTMFDVIHSYLTITDDAPAGVSRFQAELNRANATLAKIDSLKPDEKYFFVFDELFTGTGVDAGEKCAIGFIKRVLQHHNVLCIYATHFEKLKQIAGTRGGGIANYKIDDPTKNADGKLVYPFTISPGASTINIALDMAKQSGLLLDEPVNAIAVPAR